ncbi:hypothetical protein BDV97DRAFT_370460 [Delphinella strobiligena]|nr:hypothetical protein BDV97DRAFT_370460 [Delphinella strobiligena]
MQSVRQVDHDGIANASNPSLFGYHHGPVANPNEGWLPTRQRVAQQNGTKPPPITAADSAEAQPHPPLLLSTVNGLVCDIIIAEGDIMCGTQFSSQPALQNRRHIRDKHPGCILPPTRQNLSTLELARGEWALRTGPKDGLLYQYATMMERVAKKDPAFAERYGTRFHREPRRLRGSEAREDEIHLKMRELTLSTYQPLQAQRSNARSLQTQLKMHRRVCRVPFC